MKLLSNKLFTDSIKYLSSSVLSKLIGFLVLPFFVRIFGPEDYGEYSLYLVLFSFSILLFEFGTVKALTQKWYDLNDENERLSLILKVFISQFFVNVLIVFILLSFSAPISTFFNLKPLTFSLSIIVALSQLPIQFCLLYFQLSKKSTNYTIISIFSDGLVKLLSFASFFLFVAFSNVIYNEAIIKLGINGFILIIILYKLPIKKILATQINFSYLVIAQSSSILLFHNVSTLILNLSDRLIINKYLTSTDTAIYSLIYNIALIQSLILNALAISYAPRMFEMLKNQEFDKLFKLQKSILFIILILSISVATFSNEGIYIFGGEIYLKFNYISYINILGMALVSSYTVFSLVILYYKRNLILAFISISAASLNIVLNFLFIKQFGLVVGSITTVISYFLMFSLSAFYCYQKKMIPNIKTLIIRTTIHFVVIVSYCILLFVIGNVIGNIVVTFFIKLGLISSFGYFVWRNKSKLFY